MAGRPPRVPSTIGASRTPPSRIGSASNPSGVKDALCGCGEGKMARVAQATHEFAARVDALDQSTDDLAGAVDLHRRELTQIAARYRAVASRAKGALSAGSAASAIFREHNAAINAWHETVTALLSAFRRTRQPLDQLLVESQDACRQRQLAPDAPMSSEMRDWSDTCQHVERIGARFQATIERWQGAARGLEEWDRLQWREWKALAERVADAG
jgi:uncharacterized protein YukE